MVEVLSKYGMIETIEKEGNPYEIQKGLRRRKLTKTDFPREQIFKESNSFNEIHTTVKERVRSILREDKYARRNDFYLCLLYWVKTGQIKVNIDWKEWDSITKPESISRCRRELIKESLNNPELKWLLGDIETLDKRDNLDNLNHDYFQDKKNSRIAEIVK